MLARQSKPLLIALLLSLLVHVVFLLGPAFELSDWKTPPPLTVTLSEPPPKLPVPVPAPVAAPRPPPRPHVRKANPAPAPIAAVAAAAEPSPVPVPEEPPDTTATATATPTPQAEPTPEPPAPPIVQPLITERVAFPSKIEIAYSVHRGDRGIKLGTTIHKWHSAGKQYLLTSTTEAGGLFSLFYSGRYLLTSRGKITPDGLQPTSFWIQRGQSTDRTEFAEFDWEAKTLDFGKGNDHHSAVIAPGAQDQLSVFYQLALTAPHQGALHFALTTGRKFNQYTYQVLGEEILDTALGKLKTQRLTRVTNKVDSNESTDIWLAIDYHFLPVRFRLGTHDGDVLDHWVKEMRIEGARIEIPAETSAP